MKKVSIMAQAEQRDYKPLDTGDNSAVIEDPDPNIVLSGIVIRKTSPIPI